MTLSSVAPVDNDAGADRRRFAPAPWLEAPPSVLVRYQPILDVARGVAAGYQAQVASGDTFDVSRPWPLSSDVDGRLTASVVRTALAAAATLPENTFLSFPVPVAVIGTGPVRSALLAGRPGSTPMRRRLSGVILDLVGPIEPADRDALIAAVVPLRAAGAMIGVGGYGAPQPELSSIIGLRPSVIRLGRDWARGVDSSPAKRSALEAIGSMADQLDAWILVEGISSAQEISALIELRVPLAQGPFIGEAHVVWPGISTSVQCDLPSLPVDDEGTLLPFVQPTHTATDTVTLDAALPRARGVGVVVVVGDDGRPTAVVEQDETGRWSTWDAMIVNVDTAVDEVVLRALGRPKSSRFAPVVCTNSAGRLLGVLRMERLIGHLARRA